MLELILDHWIAVLVIGAGVLLPICGVLAGMAQKAVESWRRSQTDQQRAAADQELIRLKQSMVDRGMSADEIQRVLKAGPGA